MRKMFCEESNLRMLDRINPQKKFAESTKIFLIFQVTTKH